MKKITIGICICVLVLGLGSLSFADNLESKEIKALKSEGIIEINSGDVIEFSDDIELEGQIIIDSIEEVNKDIIINSEELFENFTTINLIDDSKEIIELNDDDKIINLYDNTNDLKKTKINSTILEK